MTKLATDPKCVSARSSKDRFIDLDSQRDLSSRLRTSSIVASISKCGVVEGVVEEELHVEQQVPQLAKEQADVEGMEMEKQNDVQEQAICNIQSY